MKAFITGSRAYGTPTQKSDVDLVIRIDLGAYEVLKEFADRQVEGSDSEGEFRSLIFGKLNLICCSSDKEWGEWRKGTAELRTKAPVTRDYAVDYFRRLMGKP